ncbi:MAG TPA: hypothetical protein VFQ61_21170 [Polyangiaceae bacterium]|nr:hypothetical protein [Polyangiaceae bacterium]
MFLNLLSIRHASSNLLNTEHHAAARASRSSRWLICAVALAGLWISGCGGALGQGEAEWPPLAKRWYDRAQVSFRAGDIEDAELAIENALKVVPKREEARLLAAQIALAELKYDRAVAVLEGLETSAAHAIRGRAYWYAGEVERAADELEKLLADPAVRDPWATEISKLARLGSGRKPFSVSGMLAATDMPKAGTAAMIVPLELNGEPALGLVATGSPEAAIDSSGGARSSWVSLRFGERFQVQDVPALAQDLSGLSRQVNAPIKILLGANLLRHLHATFDFTGSQFVVRSFDPPPPPAATTVKLSYVRGGGMLLRGTFGNDQASPIGALLLDTTYNFPLALTDRGWKKAGVDTKILQPSRVGGGVKEGLLPMLRIGAFDLPQVPSRQGEVALKEREETLGGLELDGLIGSGLLATFRGTLVDGGRTLWLEDLPAEALNPPPLMAPPSDGLEGLGSEDLEAAPEEEAPATKPGARPPAGKSPPPGAGRPATPGGAAPGRAPAPAPAAAPPAPKAAPNAGTPSSAAPATTPGASGGGAVRGGAPSGARP